MFFLFQILKIISLAQIYKIVKCLCMCVIVQPHRQYYSLHYFCIILSTTKMKKKNVSPYTYTLCNLSKMITIILYIFSPENVRARNDIFYLQPERSCVPDSPVWFSTSDLNQHQIDKMLRRVLMVREVQEHMLADSNQ